MSICGPDQELPVGVTMSLNDEKNKWQKRLEDLPDKLVDYKNEPQSPPKQAKKPTREEKRQALVERLIQEAMEEGKFDNLPGKGKPLEFGDNPYTEPGQDWAYGLLKRNGLAPAWIELDKEIRRELEHLQTRLQTLWQKRQANLLSEVAWQQTLTRFAQSIADLNKKIDHLNLIVPTLSVQRSRVRLENELRRLESADPQ